LLHDPPKGLPGVPVKRDKLRVVVVGFERIQHVVPKEQATEAGTVMEFRNQPGGDADGQHFLGFAGLRTGHSRLHRCMIGVGGRREVHVVIYVDTEIVYTVYAFMSRCRGAPRGS